MVTIILMTLYFDMRQREVWRVCMSLFRRNVRLIRITCCCWIMEIFCKVSLALTIIIILIPFPVKVFASACTVMSVQASGAPSCSAKRPATVFVPPVGLK